MLNNLLHNLIQALKEILVFLVILQVCLCLTKYLYIRYVPKTIRTFFRISFKLYYSIINFIYKESKALSIFVFNQYKSYKKQNQLTHTTEQADNVIYLNKRIK